MAGYQQRYQQHRDAQMGLTQEPPLAEGEELRVYDGKICRRNEQGAWYPYYPANMRPIPIY
jgi:hypothetical protein